MDQEVGDRGASLPRRGQNPRAALRNSCFSWPPETVTESRSLTAVSSAQQLPAVPDSGLESPSLPLESDGPLTKVKATEAQPFPFGGDCGPLQAQAGTLS